MKRRTGDDRADRRVLRALMAAVPDNLSAFRNIALTFGGRPSAFWYALLNDAAAHGVLGILTPHLSELDLPGNVRQELERRTVIEQLWNRQVIGSLEHAVSALDGAGLRACVLKGPMLGERLYPPRTARLSMDVDLLVRPADVDRAARVLRSAGYQGDSDADASYLLRHAHHLHFTRTGMPAVELHFRAYAGFGAVLPASALMDRATEYRLNGNVRVLVPSPEDEFVYLAIHAAGHSFIRLVWLYDLKLLLRKYPMLNWDHVANLSDASGITTAVGYTIGLLETWLGVPVGPLPRVLRRRGLRTRIADRLLTEVSAPQTRSARDNIGGLVFTSLLCDTAGSGAWLLQHHIGRTIRRRLKRRAPHSFPDRWSG